MANVIDIANFRGVTYLCADTTATTNSISGTFNYKNVKLTRAADGKLDFSADFVSDGSVNCFGFTATGTSAIDVAGWGGNAICYEGTVTSGTVYLFSVTLNAWSADIAMGTVEYSTFASQWKASKLTTGNVTGSVSGVATLGAIVPTK